MASSCKSCWTVWTSTMRSLATRSDNILRQQDETFSDDGKVDNNAAGGTVGSDRDLAKWMRGDARMSSASSGQALRPAENMSLTMLDLGCRLPRGTFMHGASVTSEIFESENYFCSPNSYTWNHSMDDFPQECWKHPRRLRGDSVWQTKETSR